MARNKVNLQYNSTTNKPASSTAAAGGAGAEAMSEDVVMPDVGDSKDMLRNSSNTEL